MDFITPLPPTRQNNVGILNVVDKLSKTIRLIPIPQNADAVTVAKLFKDHLYRIHGLPQKIISDRDIFFRSKFRKTLFKLLGTKIAPSTAYHPQTDGQTEIANSKVEEMMRAFPNFRKDDSDEHLVDFEVAYNSSIHSTTLYSPFNWKPFQFKHSPQTIAPYHHPSKICREAQNSRMKAFGSKSRKLPNMQTNNAFLTSRSERQGLAIDKKSLSRRRLRIP